MERQSFIFIFAILFQFLILSCHVSNDSPLSQGTHQMSLDTKSISKKMRSLDSSLPSDDQLCFGAEILGPGLPTQTLNKICPMSTGVFVGFVEPGKTLDVGIPEGKNRTINLYAMRRNAGEACQDYIPVLQSPISLKSLYKVGSSTSLTVSGSDMNIDISAQFPGISQSVFNTQKWESSCYAFVNAKPSGIKIVLARATSVNDAGSIKVKIAAHGSLK